jgi:hypothetical protein
MPFANLLEILKPHADVKPIQHMVGLWRDAPLNRAKTGRAVGKIFEFRRNRIMVREDR